MVGIRAKTAEQDSGLPRLVAFMPTPFRDGRIDVDAAAAQAGYLGGRGAETAVLGGLGEFYAVGIDEARELFEACAAGAAGRVRTHAGIGFATREARLLAAAAAASGIDALVVNPPYYVAPTPAGFAEHVRAIAGESGLPVVVYSSRFLAIVDDYLEQLVRIEGFQGVKDEVSDPQTYRARVERWGSRVEWWTVGERHAADYLAAGATVVTSALANISAALSWSCVRAAAEGGDFPAIFHEWTQARLPEPGAEHAAIKWMLRSLRSWSGEVRLPNQPLSPSGEAKVAAFLASLEDCLATEDSAISKEDLESSRP